MGYQSIFSGGATPTIPSYDPSKSTLPSSSYTSIFTPKAHIVASRGALDAAKNQEQNQLSQQMNPYGFDYPKIPAPGPNLPALDAAVTKNTTGGFMKNLGIAGPKGVAEAAGGAVNKVIAQPIINTGKIAPNVASLASANVTGNKKAATNARSSFINSATGSLIGPAAQLAVAEGTNLGANKTLNNKNLSDQQKQSFIKTTLNPSYNKAGLDLTASPGKTALQEAELAGGALALPILTKGGMEALKGRAGALEEAPKEAPSPTPPKSPEKTSTPVETQTKPGQGSAIPKELNPLAERIKSSGAAFEDFKPTSAESSALKSAGTNLKDFFDKVKVNNEAGAVSPGAAVSDAKALINKHQQSVEFSGDINKFQASSEGAKGNLLNDAAKLTKNRTQLSNDEKTQLQDLRDARMTGSGAPKVSDKVLQADKESTDFAKAKIQADAERATLEGNLQKADSILKQDPESYTHRAAQGKGSAFDYVLQGDRKNPLGVGMGKTTPADKARTLFSATDEEGNRQIVSVKSKVFKDERGQKVGQGKVVNAISNGGKESERLGTLKLKSGQDFLDKEVKPYKNRLTQLQQQYKVLSKVKVREGIPRGQIESLAKRVEDLRNYNLFKDLPTRSAKSFDRAHIQLKALNDLKYFKNQSNVPAHIDKILGKIDDLKEQIDNAAAEYTPDELKDKKFVQILRDENGKKIGEKIHTIGQAGASEITKATGTKYFTDPYLTNQAAYLDSRVALENARMFDAIKKSPLSEKFMSGPGETAPKGWKSVPGLDQFRGYKFDPRTADALHDAFVRGKGDPNVLDKVGQVLRQTIVYFPIKHDFNILSSYVIDRGLSGLARPIPALKSLYLATQDVSHNTDFYQELAKKGFELTTNDRQAFEKVFTKELTKLTDDKPAIAQIAKSIGTSPARLYNAIQRVSVWDVQDIANIARVRERMASGILKKGMSMEDAIKQTERYSFQYKVPERVAGTRSGSQLLQSNKVFFGRYRYDQYKIVGNIMKDSLKLKNPKQAVQAYDKMAALVVGAVVAWPLVDKGVQKVTGDKNAYIKAPGPMELVETGQKLIKGKESPNQAASNQVFLSSGLTIPLDVLQNNDPFTGKKIVDPNTSKNQQGKDLTKWLYAQFAPGQRLTATKNATTNKVVATVLSIAGTSMPKNSPFANKLNSLKYDTLPTVEKNAKAKVKATGNPSQAQPIIDEYNQSVLAAAKEDLKSKNLPIPSDQDLISQLKKSGIYYQPKQKTIQGWTQPAKAVVGGFTP